MDEILNVVVALIQAVRLLIFIVIVRKHIQGATISGVCFGHNCLLTDSGVPERSFPGHVHYYRGV